MNKWRQFWTAWFSRGTIVRGLKVAFVVGLILTGINQGADMMAGRGFNALQAVLTYFVPYCVASYSAAMTSMTMSGATLETVENKDIRRVIDFWFTEARDNWWAKDAAFDRRLQEDFGVLIQAAIRGELEHWRETPEGRLAEIILLDQFSRNIHRDTAGAFANDAQALTLAQEAARVKADQMLEPEQRAFLYMPFMHSESLSVHEQALALFDQPGLENNLEFEKKHKAIIDRFGRYPHRNDVLGRTSTPEEVAFLEGPGSSF